MNGKLDVAALPIPDYTAPGYQAPTTPVEEIVAGIYAGVLGLERVGTDQSFFDLGGDSLLAMRVVAAVNTALGADLSVRVLFDAPTVAELTPHIGPDRLRRCVWWRSSGPRRCPYPLPSTACGPSSRRRARRLCSTSPGCPSYTARSTWRRCDGR
ncbi:phosphopantetheine attachment site family protein [Mycobacterium kansasii]|uniref:Phosphopantetheine attachment site family protein n=1 Tax=Mycobacterium kansasii TaxID=1768 RepID=A0A1V3XAX5_MYCKA|nr:phosphopantetheine attachment site family protein [Mycobacterium kansasii]